MINNERGTISIMLVLAAVALVTPFVVNFTFDTHINKLKVYNIQDRAKAKLTAESGLQFAMARLKLYKAAYNLIQENKNLKDSIKPEVLDTIWNFPFVYPIPTTEEMNATQKSAINEFIEKTVLEGSIQLSIDNISNRINLNLLRISLMNESIKKAQKGVPPEEEMEQPKEEDLEFNPENQLVKILNTQIEAKSLESDSFNSNFATTDLNILVNELKYYLSDPNSVEDSGGGDQNFQSSDFSAKRAPMTSFSEMYSLPAWNDEITNLILNEFTIHGAIMIDLNKITDKLLKILIPDIQEEDIKEFFEYKNDPENPKHFNTLEDFKKYFISVANIMSDSEFDNRFDKYKAQGLQFGPTPTLFKVQSTGVVGRSTFNLIAYIVIPAKPKPRIPPKDPDNPTQPPTKPQIPTTPGTDDKPEPEAEAGEDGEKPAEEEKTLLLEPRIVEIIIS